MNHDQMVADLSPEELERYRAFRKSAGDPLPDDEPDDPTFAEMKASIDTAFGGLHAETGPERLNAEIRRAAGREPLTGARPKQSMNDHIRRAAGRPAGEE